MTSREVPPSLRRLLLVDDTPEDRALVRRMLRRGASGDLYIHEADSVAAGVQALEENEVDCVLLDHNLPDGHGVDVLAELRRRQDGLPIAAVYLTNAGVEAAAVAALQAGAQDFVSKDALTPETVWRAVDNAIERVGLTRALAESERRWKALSEDLEHRVAKRTEDLQKAVDEISGFTYSVSHDLRAPIRAVVSSSRILIEDYADQLSPAAVAELQRQAVAGEKLGRLVDGLLDYARLGREQFRPEPIDVSKLVERVSETIRGEGWHGKDADFSIQPGLRAVADPAMLETVFTVLMDNAGKYHRPGTRSKIEVLRDGEAFCVRDDGIGFDMRYVEKLFRPFERLHRDTEYEGTGIGLANARRIVERHGGRIWAESTPDGGASFCFTLGV